MQAAKKAVDVGSHDSPYAAMTVLEVLPVRWVAFGSGDRVDNEKRFTSRMHEITIARTHDYRRFCILFDEIQHAQAKEIMT